LFFADLYEWSASIVGELTLVQIDMYIAGQPKKKKEGIKVGSIREAKALLKASRK